MGAIRGGHSRHLSVHAFLGATEDPARLSANARSFITDPTNTILLSVASVWEIVIKHKLGKLPLGMPLAATLSRLPTVGIGMLPIRADHALAVEHLPDPHEDPFDRMLAAQEMIERAALITADPIFPSYPVSVVW